MSKRFSNQFRSPRSTRFVADMSIQMILGESTSLIAAVGFIQLYNFMYNCSDDIFFVGLQWHCVYLHLTCFLLLRPKTLQEL